LPIRFPDELPVCARRDEIGQAIRVHPVVIVCGETGSGKTTQLPKICLALGRGTERMIGHTQPRRIAASSVARRIAEELATPLGEVVGYKVRFTDHTREGVAVKLMTDGILLAETQRDPLLAAYDTIIIDEAHERSLNIDFLLGYLRQLLPKRPDLKLIITSATLDAERFARHFGSPQQPAPVINVSGRLYPVEVRYRAVRDEDDADDRTLMDAIVDAVDELSLAGRGDVLVFLPGEREIREAAEALRKRHPPGTEILPLYARLSVEEQERVFKPGAARRLVLATNIAETSLTVPGVRYVVDSGLARVKRYSYRNKVEQLQVEPISQAAAAQRAGRCGRVADGICVRLYDEPEYARRPPFTDPEILRSSLAAVILQMKSLGLGDVAEFPFVQPPPSRAIADGYQLLAELNAVDERHELTPIGRELAHLPLDPCLGRMLLAARDQQCLREMLIIASALSGQDPRERPLDAQEAADRAHRRFADERSEFAGLVKLWDALQERQAHKKSNRRFAEELKQEFISPRRLREWIDVHAQLHRIVAELGWRVNASPPTYEQLHLALLSGLLGNIGCKSPDADPADRREPPYLGARSIKFHVWPGSPIARKAGRWIVAAELVETSRLFARTVAAIEPAWLEKAGAHLLKCTYSEPHWEKRPAQVVAFERATLYGLLVYQQRRVHYGPIDPAAARTLFIREALVAGDFDTRAAFMAHNQKLVREIRELEHKARRPDVLVDDETIFAFYEQRVPAQVASGAAFERWRAQAEQADPRLLFLSREELMRHESAGVTAERYPKSIAMGGLEMALTYHFEPGSPRDGVTLTVPLVALNQVDPLRCEWLVPGLLKEKAQLLLKSLPQKLRRHLVPLPEYAQGFLERWSSPLPQPSHRLGEQEGASPAPSFSSSNPFPAARREGEGQGVRVVDGLAPTAASVGLIDALIRDAREHAGVACSPPDFKLESLPAHLTMNFKVVDEQGRQLAMGRNLASLQAELGAQARRQFQQAADAEAAPVAGQQQPITDWDFGELPQQRQIHRDGHTLVAYPALVDQGNQCALEVFDDPLVARARHREGLRRLFRLQLRQQIQYLERSLSSLQTVRMQASVVPSLSSAAPSFEDLRDQVVGAAIDRTCLEEPWPVNREQFLERKENARGRLNLIAQQIAGLLASIVQEALPLPKKLAASRAFAAACSDVEQQLARLFPKRFVEQTPAAQLAHYPRYLKAIAVRLDKLKNDPGRDKALMAELGPLQTAYARAVAARKGVPDARLEEFRWLLEELRVSLFAQELRTPMPVSVKRLQKVWASLEG
jgi:ATP-dependent helicase HrpA